MPEKAKIIGIEQVTHDVKKFTVEKPKGFVYEPGQACELAIDQPGWTDEARPFTMTSLKAWDMLEFIIKAYPEHDGVTKKLHELDTGDFLLVHNAFGTIQYKGPGVFIAGGAGITPFIAMFRQLQADSKLEGNMLIFANKTSKDIILREELIDVFGQGLVLVLSKEDAEGYEHGRIDGSMIKKHVRDFSQHFYVCGPPAMNDAVLKVLRELGARPDSLVFEGKQ